MAYWSKEPPVVPGWYAYFDSEYGVRPVYVVIKAAPSYPNEPLHCALDIYREGGWDEISRFHGFWGERLSLPEPPKLEAPTNG